MSTVVDIKAMADAMDRTGKTSQPIRVTGTAAALSKAARTPGTGISETAGKFYFGLHQLVIEGKR